VVNSVHSFTQSPIGPLFLTFLGICLVASIILLSLRIDTLVSEPSEDAVVSREGAFLLNNLLLVTFTFTVLVGTIFPIIAEAVRGVKVSVGEPYFNRMAVPICLGLLFLIGIGPALPWGRADKRALQRALVWPLPAGIVGLGIALLAGARSWSLLLTAFLAGYALWVTLDQALRPARLRAKKGESAGQAVLQTFVRAPRRTGAYLVHLGVIVTFVAIAISSTYKENLEATLAPGQSAALGGYNLTFKQLDIEQEPHLTAQKATIQIEHDGKDEGTLQPRFNHYPTQREPIGTPAVRTTLTHDLYLTVMNVGEDGRIGLRAIVTPAVVWVWLGVLIMVAGTVICLIPPRSVAVAEKARTAEANA